METPGRARRQQYWLLGCVAYVVFAFGLGCGPVGEAQGPGASPAGAGSPATDESPQPAEPVDGRSVVLFLGTSLTAGYGLPSDQAFAALIQQRIDSEGLPFRTVNAGVSGDTSAGGLRRVDWLLRQPIAVLILELGANDMLRGQSAAMMRDNLRSILDLTREAMPDVQLVIAGMRAAPNLGAAYAREFDSVFPQLATEYDAALIPFLLEGVASVRGLNQPDGIHPTADGHEILANTVWRVLSPLLRRSTQERY